MRKNLIVVALVVLVLSCCTLNTSAIQEETKDSYNEAEEAGKRVINSIKQASDLVNGEWDGIEINGLYVRLFDEITETVKKEGEVENYQIVEIDYSDDNQYFSIKVKPTVYHIKRGDTLTKIAKKKGITVDNLLELNPEITDPDLIYEGNTLKIR